MTKFLFLVIFIISQIEGQRGLQLVGNPLAFFHPCEGNDNITIVFEPGLPPEEENQYDLFIYDELPAHSKINLQFDSEATVNLSDPTVARITTSPRDKTLNVRYFKNAKFFGAKVKGPATGTVPYLTSAEVNFVEACERPKTGYLDDLIQGYKGTAEITLTVPDGVCGRRKVTHKELIVSGQPTKPGDWPWHAALYTIQGTSISYICGGTLVSKSIVVTAAHCVTIRGEPRVAASLSVILGKYNLIGGDIASQEREVQAIIIHEDYDFKVQNNDLALLRLKSEAVFDDYVQPACVWYPDAYKKLPPGQVYGTVVGWGFTQLDQLSPQLQQAYMPKVSESVCLKSNPVFFSKALTSTKFCAGHKNGTSACNGDSGGGFSVFVPDVSGDTSSNATGAWYLRGIVSLSVARRDIAICDPTQYVLFTDLAKYRGWLSKFLKD